MSIKRSFTVKITFKEGYGNPITLTGKDATAFNTAWHNKLNDQDGAIGFEWPVITTRFEWPVIPTTGESPNQKTVTTWTSFLFCNVAKVERSEQTETKYTDDQCHNA